MAREYLSPTQAAKILGISRQAVIDRIKHGVISAEKAGRQYIIPND
jgi:excisionase family DNA binding protein